MPRLALAAVALLTGCAGQLVGARPRPAPASRSTSPPTPSRSPGSATSPVDQFARNALTDLNAFWAEAYPEFFGEDFTPLENGYFSVDSERDRRERLPRHRHRLRGLPDAARLGRRQRVLRPGVRPDRLRPGAAGGALHRLRPLPRPGGDGPRVRPRHAGPVRLRRLRAQHPGRDAGRLLRRRLDGLGRRRARPSTSRSARPSSTTSSAASCCCATTSAATPTTPRRTAPTSTGCRRSTRASTAGSAPCRDDFGADRLYTAAAFDRDATSQPGQRGLRRHRRLADTTLPAFWSEVFPTAFDTDFTPPRSRGSTAPRPTARASQDRDLGYCAADATVYVDETDLADAGLRRDRRLRPDHRAVAALLAGRA